MSRALGLIAAVVSGTAIAVQTRINGELGRRLDDGVAAATLSFGIGLAVMCVVMGVSRRNRHGLAMVRTALREHRLRYWQLLGGACGAYLVVCQGLTVATLGVAVFSVSVVAGQLVSSLLVDRAGIGPGQAQPLTPRRLLSAGIAMVAVGIAVADKFAHPSGLAFSALVALAGFGIAWQQAVNGRVRQAANVTAPAAFINFVVGTSVLLVVFAGVCLIRGLPQALPTQWWLYLGGPLGVFFIAIAARVVAVIGVLLLGLATVAGQLSGAVLLDWIVPTPGHALTVNAVVATLIALIAVWVVARPQRNRSTKVS